MFETEMKKILLDEEIEKDDKHKKEKEKGIVGWMKKAAKNAVKNDSV